MRTINLKSHNQHNEQGFTLIELMIGITLGLILSGMLISVYINNKKVYHENLVFSAMQENTRFAARHLGHDLRMAGFFDGADRLAILNSASVNALITTPPTACHGSGFGFTPYENYNQVISVYRIATTSTPLPTCLNTMQLVVGSDILFVRLAIPVELNDVQNGIERTRHMMGSEVTADLIAPEGDIPDGKILEYRYHVYFVSMRDGAAFPSLRRLRLEGGSWIEEMVADGIEDVHIILGIASSGGALTRYYKNATDIPSTDWENVVAAKFFIRSQIKLAEPGFSDKRIYEYGNRSFNPRLHQITFFANGSTVSRSYDRYKRRLSETSLTLYNNQMQLR
jgi:type IV pilus assembly protein PilW